MHPSGSSLPPVLIISLVYYIVCLLMTKLINIFLQPLILPTLLYILQPKCVLYSLALKFIRQVGGTAVPPLLALKARWK